jgi:hypothetical protein
MKRKAILILLASFVWVSILQAGVAEDHLARIRHDLDSLAVSDPRFGTFVDVSVTAFPVADLLKSLAIGNGLNINLSLDRFRGQITCNLEQVPIKDVLFLCCRENGLDLTVDSGIVNIFPYAEVPLCRRLPYRGMTLPACIPMISAVVPWMSSCGVSSRSRARTSSSKEI